MSEIGVVPTGGQAWKGDTPETAGKRDSHSSHEAPVSSSSAQWSGNASALVKNPAQPGVNSAAPASMHRRSYIRHKLQGTEWYHSAIAVRIRTVLHGKFAATIMVIALLLALFLPDICILASVNNNVAIDLVMFIVMLLFTAEFFLLCSVDATYLLSFFFLMDIIGTVSMVFDISWMFGPDITAEQMAGDAGNKNNLMLLRASRTARVGARAGRLSRVLRVLRFLPFLTNKRAETSAGISKAISGQLANLLATRVACLTILLVMVIPLFDLLTFPQSDYSLQTWVERLSTQAVAGRMVDMETELKLMVDFYKDQNYGPYLACTGSPHGKDTFNCEKILRNWSPVQKYPTRGSSALWVHTDTFMIGFNFQTPTQLEAGMAMLNILFIMFIMVFSGMALSSVVTALAVAPLESMLATVRQIAATVFKFSGNEREDEEEEDFDIDSSSEMKLLERVVQKLAIVADLQMGGTANRITEDMEEEDIGILNMMEGKNIVEEKIKQDRRSMAAPRKKAVLTSISTDFGVPEDVVNSFAFSASDLTKRQRMTLAIFDIAEFHPRGEGFINCTGDELVLKTFVNAAEAQYLPNPFHNFAHAVDVLHYTARIMRMISSEDFLNELEQFSLLIAAIGHDLGHPGVNNGFLSEVGHELALQYNDRAPLENMHCAKLYGIVKDSKESDVFASMTKEQYTESRSFIIESILHTDMMAHQAMVNQLQMVWEVNTEVFNKRGDPQMVALVQLQEADMFNQGDTKLLTMENILHSADVSNPCRTWECSQAWAWCVLEEFFAQGDQEKMLGVPVQFLNDRDKLNRPNSQIGFLEFMIAPFYAAQIRLWPGLFEFGDNLSSNIVYWEQMWAKETNPEEESRAKVLARVQKVRDNLADAKSCGYAQMPPRT